MSHTSNPELRAAFAAAAKEIEVLEAMPVGPAMIAGLYALRATIMDTNAAVRCATLWSQATSWTEAERMVAVTEVTHGVGPFSADDPISNAALAAQELALAGHVSFATAMAHVELTTVVGACMPSGWEALDRGALSLAHLRSLHDATRHATPKVVAAVANRVVPVAIDREWTPSELRRAALRALHVIDPDGCADRAANAKAAAEVRFRPGEDETALLTANGDALTLRQIYDTLDARATQLHQVGDSRTLGQLRIRALADAVLGDGADDRAGELALVDTATGAVVSAQPRRCSSHRAAWTRARRRGEAMVSIDLNSLVGLTNTPGELAGYGPISAQSARAFARDASWRRLLTDPVTGASLDLGRTRYRPSAELRRLVEALNLTCQMTGCTRPARQCDIDHVLEWLSKGRTERANLHPLCRMHHQLKTAKLYTLIKSGDGDSEWRSPAGFTYTNRRTTYPVELLTPPTDDELPPDQLDGDVPTDPDPPHQDAPLPVPPPLTDDEFDEFHRALYDNFVDSHAARCYDTLRAAGLVA